MGRMRQDLRSGLRAVPVRMARSRVVGIQLRTRLSISDITGGIAWLWTYPADYLLRLPAVASFLELEPNHVGGGLSGAITFGFAALVGIFIKAVLDDMSFHRQA